MLLRYFSLLLDLLLQRLIYHLGQCTYPCFPEVLFKPVLRTIFFPSHWLLSNITIVETTNSDERGMNPVAMTIINPRKKYWPSRGSNQQPSVLKSATLPTELTIFSRIRLSYGIVYFLDIFFIWLAIREEQHSDICEKCRFRSACAVRAGLFETILLVLCIFFFPV